MFMVWERILEILPLFIVFVVLGLRSRLLFDEVFIIIASLTSLALIFLSVLLSLFGLLLFLECCYPYYILLTLLYSATWVFLLFLHLYHY